MYPSLQVANTIIKKAIADQNPITHLKLQKILYLANGINLARTGSPLIGDLFEAWRLGPVLKPVYDYFKGFGNREITSINPYYNPLDLNEPSLENKAILEAWEIGKNVDALTLSNWTHLVSSPWFKAKSSNFEYINNEDLKHYFRKTFKIQPLDKVAN